MGLMVMAVGCTKEIHNHYSTKEVIMPPQEQQYHLERQNTSFVEQPVWYTQSKSQSSKLEKDVCDVLYSTYKQCYGMGIQLNDTDMCLSASGELSSRITQEFGDHEIGVMFGTICAVACESANRNMSMPSYDEFSHNNCQ